MSDILEYIDVYWASRPGYMRVK